MILVSSSLAMSSQNYSIDWYLPMTGSGGGEAGSTNYAVNFSVGQTVIGASSSNNYHSGLGYWYGLLLDQLKTLPIIFK
jgi:hypothetical protein